jgi:hypothetical protein
MTGAGKLMQYLKNLMIEQNITFMQMEYRESYQSNGS